MMNEATLAQLPKKGVVLVIDDDAVCRDLMTRMLATEGLTIYTATNGMDGIRMARQLRPAVIVLDVMMPGMDGWTVLSVLKADPELSSIPVIMATMVDENRKGYALGASDYLVKPVDWERMSRVLKMYSFGRDTTPVLLVEDEPDVRRMMRRSLESEGWRVVEAGNGRVALQKAQEHRPGLILLDLMMPEMDGFQFLEAFRQTEEGRSVPIIILTAMELTDNDRQRLTSSVTQVVSKGTHDRDDLLKDVSHLVNGFVERATS